MTRPFARLLPMIGSLVAGTVALAGASAFAQDRGGFATYRNDKHGFSLTYPAGQFLALPPATPDGFQALSRDGKARLLVGTLANFDRKSLAACRNFILTESYPGATVTYAPVRGTWFVLSGVQKDGSTAFYQRVNLVCGGRNINSWAVIFPNAEKPLYAPIIEQLHRDYSLGDGNCGKLTMMQPEAGNGTRRK